MKKIGQYQKIAITDDVVLTEERLEKHILVKHLKEYEQLKSYLKKIIEEPDVILNDNKNENTLMLLRKIPEIESYGRVIIKLATEDDKKHPKNSIITIMKLNDRTWKQTLKNRGNIIFFKNTGQI